METISLEACKKRKVNYAKAYFTILEGMDPELAKKIKNSNADCSVDEKNIYNFFSAVKIESTMI